MRILFISRWFPWPTDNGSKLRIYNLLRGLSGQHHVTLLSFTDQPGVDVNTPEIRALCHDAHTVPWEPFSPLSRRAISGYFSLAPRSLVDTYSLEMQRQIEAALASHDYDLVIASQGAAAEYGSCFQGVPALYEEVELGVFYEQYACATSTRARLRYGLTWLKHRCHLARQLRHFRACTVVSAQERNLLLHAAPHCVRVEVIPNSLNLADYAVARAVQPNTLIFTGPFVYRVNYNAMCWFLTEIYPKVQAQEPDVHLTITGDHAGLPLPAAANVTLTGCVDDVRPLIASSCVSLAPLLEGGGTRLKILEAMALRTPVVATHKGAEGLNARSGEHLLIADTPAEFAQSVVRLCRDSGLRQRLGNSAYSFVSAEYSWAATMPRFLNLIERVAD